MSRELERLVILTKDLNMMKDSWSSVKKSQWRESNEERRNVLRPFSRTVGI